MRGLRRVSGARYYQSNQLGRVVSAGVSSLSSSASAASCIHENTNRSSSFWQQFTNRQQQQQEKQQQPENQQHLHTQQRKLGAYRIENVLHLEMQVASGCRLSRLLRNNTTIPNRLVTDRIPVQSLSGHRFRRRNENTSAAYRSSFSSRPATFAGAAIAGIEEERWGGRGTRAAASREAGVEGTRAMGGPAGVRGGEEEGEEGEDVVIAIGGNMGDRVRNFHEALEMLRQAGVHVYRHGCLYESAPAYVTDQPFFLNSAIQARTTLSPHALLSLLKYIEARLGRNLDPTTAVRFGPRPLDLDLIFYGARTVQSDASSTSPTAADHATSASSSSSPSSAQTLSLEVPHPRLAERSFVLAPVMDLLGRSREEEGVVAGDKEAGSEEREPSWVFHEAFGKAGVPGLWKSLGGEAVVGGTDLRRVIPLQHRSKRGRSEGTSAEEKGSEGRGGLWAWEGAERPLVMGILNVTPDSFSDGGRFLRRPATEASFRAEPATGCGGAGTLTHHITRAAAAAAAAGDNADDRGSSASTGAMQRHVQSTAVCQRTQEPQERTEVERSGAGDLRVSSEVVDVAAAVREAERMVAEGADIIDVGGQSTRPGAARLSTIEELTRVIPVIKGIRSRPSIADVIISVDTFDAEVARSAAFSGADIINDVSGGRMDPQMLPTVAALNLPFVLMHMRGDPTTMQSSQNTTYKDLIADVAAELACQVAAAERAGIPLWNIILDPGIGFAKTGQQNLELIRNLGQLRRELGRWRKGLQHVPMLLGPSRKGFLGKITGRPGGKDRDWATCGAVAGCVAGGADIVRVHNAAAGRDAALVAAAIFRGGLLS